EPEQRGEQQRAQGELDGDDTALQQDREKILRVAKNGLHRPDRAALTRDLFQIPFHQDLVERAVGLQLGERRIDLLQQLLIGLAHPDTDASGHFRLVRGYQLCLEIRVLRQLILEDRRVAEAGLDAAKADIAQDVSQRIVDLDLGKIAVFFQKVDVNRAHLRANDLTLE